MTSSLPTPIDAVRPLDPARFAGELDGRAVALYVLRNAHGMVACITNYGAKVEQLLVPDAGGRLADVVLGYDSLDAARAGAPYVGAFVGRYAGRIGNASFVLDGQAQHLSVNNSPHCLHGGVSGSAFRVFDAVQPDSASVEMSLVFADGDEGFPGSLALKLRYSLTDANELVIEYEALALDKPTVVSLTTHCFFNLNGDDGDVLGHEVMISADRYFEMTPDLIATGRLLAVAGTPMDLRKPVLLGERIGRRRSGTVDHQSEGAIDGFDDCFLLSKAEGQDPTLAARVVASASGRTMEVWSTEPALQLYTGMSTDLPLAGGPGKQGVRYCQQHSLCLEPQGYPNAPNHPQFQSSRLDAGQSRTGKTIYRFGALRPQR